MKNLNKFINNFHVLPADSYKNFYKLTELKKFSNKEILAKYGETPKDLFILKSGIVRSYYTDEKGKEYIRSLFTPFSATGALGALILDKTSDLSYDCLTDCELYAINFKDLKLLALKDKDIAYMYASALESVFLLLESRIYDLTVLNATMRYDQLKKVIPDIENLIPQYHIASFLNISPVQLSRIRKELYSK
ncbi:MULTISPECIES: Crp/Fnr family transcriptional regulator [unclassified Polaribacter]|uniref:Crp/Fnr family transcriptional regulator n=1 Tax=unclassified Polaribacter TaxID=196858 RepID=UPI0011BEE32D|nr:MULTISPECIES: Crp/Fnr family transcriptional regulator [unclassified Polaribacter]TXD52044.1 Crp/Fnr family transcriptional regulator [Polaribacter sp. IC063]TXD59766.1 Crp/Fnr family transcriptional regulator [Polaribacter sp. IC066]